MITVRFSFVFFLTMEISQRKTGAQEGAAGLKPSPGGAQCSHPSLAAAAQTLHTGKGRHIY